METLYIEKEKFLLQLKLFREKIYICIYFC